MRSTLYRPATAAELASGTIVLEPESESCTMTATGIADTCTTTPAVTRQFHDEQDAVVSAIAPKDKSHYLALFDDHLGRLIPSIMKSG